MKSASLVCAVFAALSLPMASADAATLTITGRVLPGTCTLATPAISLDPVKATDITVGSPSGVKPGVVNLTGCIGVTRARLSFDGTAADGDPQRWKNTVASAPAAGVSIALLSGTTGTGYLKKGDTDIAVTVSGATASYALRAGYYVATNSGINAGNVSTEITITAAYD